VSGSGCGPASGAGSERGLERAAGPDPRRERASVDEPAASREPLSRGPIFALFAKPAVAGEVKTRLSPPLTEDEAVQVYQAMLADTAGVLAATGRSWAVLSTDPEKQAATWPAGTPRPPLWRRQTGRDLGERMLNAVTELADEGFDPVIVVGSDHPTLPPDFLERAVSLLAARDVAVGPTFDGGYYLLGMHRPHPELFANIPWSTADVFRLTLDRLAAAGLTAGVLPPWYDVDRPEDLRVLRDHLEGAGPEEGAPARNAADAAPGEDGPAAAPCPRTRDVLRRLHLDRPEG
jgi:rSAM/selenodomain-associated transferase 1